MEPPRARDDLEGFGATILAHQHRHDDAMAAHGRQDVGHIRRFLKSAYWSC
jgi:hypothetical protein